MRLLLTAKHTAYHVRKVASRPIAAICADIGSITVPSRAPLVPAARLPLSEILLLACCFQEMHELSLQRRKTANMSA
jgi:hypothetical protein